MSGEEKNLKDSERKNIKDISSVPAPYQAAGFGSGSYKKTQKLITALYMVTDIIDKDEPLRNKLRTLGVQILSDTISLSRLNLDKEIQEVLSFLSIASDINIISEMNCAILRKEFLELKNSGQEHAEIKPAWLEEFLGSGDAFLPPLPGEDLRRGFNSPHPNPLLKGEGEKFPKGHTRIGVQKGSTLLKAIKDMSNKMPVPYEAEGFRTGVFDVLKKQRREDIISIIKNFTNGATITDIKDKIKTMPEQTSSLVSCSEKTLQRELVSMVKDGVLNKTGEKRWSRYFVHLTP